MHLLTLNQFFKTNEDVLNTQGEYPIQLLIAHAMVTLGQHLLSNFEEMLRILRSIFLIDCYQCDES